MKIRIWWKRFLTDAFWLTVSVGLSWLLLHAFARGAPRPVARAKKEVEKFHPALFVGVWDMTWAGLVYRTTLSPDGSYRAVEVGGGQVWLGKWWVDEKKVFWVEEVEQGSKFPAIPWGVILSGSLAGKVSVGACLGTKVALVRAKPDA